MLETAGGDQTLDARSLSVFTAVLASDRSADNQLLEVFSGSSLFGQTVEFADVISTLGTQTAGDLLGSQAINVFLTGLDDGERNNGHIGAQNCTVDTLSLALTSSAGTVDLVTLAEKESDTTGDKNTGHAGETLFVVTTGNLDSVASGETYKLAVKLLANTSVPQITGKVLVVELNKFLRAVRRVRNVELDHCEQIERLKR